MDLWRRVMEGEGHVSLGYGCMRFPQDRTTHRLDWRQADKLIARAMEGGIRYYDTAWPYHGGESEPFLGEALARYPRDSYLLATKLPCWEVDRLERARELIEEQLRRLKTEYVDVYLLHSLTKKTWEQMEALGVPQLLEEYRAKGALKHIGFSFHDSYQVFERILSSRSWDLCQIQLNYMDVEHQAGLKGLALARSKGVPVVVMEPVKGGSLAQLPVEVAQPLRGLDPAASDAAWALRWVASQPGVRVVLSGMSTMEQLEDNLSVFTPLRTLSAGEEAGMAQTAELLRRRLKNGCTGCRYCMPCPSGVDIPKNFQIWNSMAMYQNQKLTRRAWRGLEPAARGNQCVGCGRCEELCPQHIPIREHLAQACEQVEAFANPSGVPGQRP